MKEEQIEAIRKNAKEASGLPFTAWTVTQAVEKDIPTLLAEVVRLHEGMTEIAEIVSDFYTEQGGIRLPQNLTPVAGELRVIHSIATAGER